MERIANKMTTDDQPIRVLHVKNKLFYDGVTIIEHRIAERLKAKNIIYDWFLISDEEGIFEERFEALGSRIYRCSEFAQKYKTRFPSIVFYKFVKECKYDYVYFDTDFSGRAYWLLWARFAGVERRMIHSHNSDSEGGVSPLVNNFFKLIMRFAATDYLACSRKAAYYLFPRDKAEKAMIVKNGVDAKKFAFNQASREEIRNRYGISEDCLVLGHVGRFSKVKNHEKLIGIFNAFQKIHSNSKLILIGTGELMQSIKDQVESMNLSDKVIFVGSTDDVPSYLSAMDVFVFPSFFEGFGMVVLEALTSGLQVYASDCLPSEILSFDDVIAISLSLSDEEWALKIHDCLKDFKINRDVAYKVIVDKGYDITDVAEDVANLVLTDKQ